MKNKGNNGVVFVKHKKHGSGWCLTDEKCRRDEIDGDVYVFIKKSRETGIWANLFQNLELEDDNY